MKKLFVSFITTFLLVFMLTSCPGLMSDQTCSVSFCIDGVELAKEINNYASSREGIGDDCFMTISLEGEYNASQTVTFADEMTVTFDDIPVGTKLRVLARIYVLEVGTSGSTENVLASGESDEVVVKKGKNEMTLWLGPPHTVTFTSDDGVEINSQTVDYGKKAVRPDDPTKEGFVFAGWYVDEEFRTAFDFNTAITEDTTLYAKWVTAYQVGMASEIRNGSVIADKTSAAAGATVTLTFKPSEGFELNSLSIKDADGRKIDTRVVTAGEKYTFTMPAVNVTVFATFMTHDGFVKVNGGTFDGTSTLTPESCIFINGRNLTIPDFYMCTHEVTQKEYETYCTYTGTNKPKTTYGKGDNYPVYYVSWFDALVYCNRRSIAENLDPCYSIDGETNPDEWGDVPTSDYSAWQAAECDWTASGYRLPMEVEWEYAARNENKDSYDYSGSDNLDEVAWCKDNSDGKAHEVRQKAPNGLGIYDMTGNVWEWCWDVGGNGGINATTPVTGKEEHSYGYRVRRGEGYNNETNEDCNVGGRSGSCLTVSPYGRNTVGFRVVRSISE